MFALVAWSVSLVCLHSVGASGGVGLSILPVAWFRVAACGCFFAFGKSSEEEEFSCGALRLLQLRCVHVLVLLPFLHCRNTLAGQLHKKLETNLRAWLISSLLSWCCVIGVGRNVCYYGQLVAIGAAHCKFAHSHHVWVTKFSSVRTAGRSARWLKGLPV